MEGNAFFLEKMSKKSDADMYINNVEFSACRTAHTHTHTTQHNNKYNIKQRQRERQTKKTEESETGQGRDGTGQDRTGLQTDGQTLRESWLPITHACYDFSHHLAPL